MNINDWKIYNTDEEIKTFILSLKDDLIHINNDIQSEAISNFYNMVVTNTSLTDRAKLFHLEQFENLLINSKINSTKGVINYSNSLFK